MGAVNDKFKFALTGNRDVPFLGYNSQQDPTNLSSQYLVGGSKNVYLTNTGTVEVRPGLKRIGDIDISQDGIVASYEFETAGGVSLPIRVLQSGTMQFRFSDVWYDLKTFDNSRFIFSLWWDDANKKEELIMVNGDSNLYMWTGAFIPAVGATTSGTSIFMQSTNAAVNVLSLRSTDDSVNVGSNSPQSPDGTENMAAIVFDINPPVGSITYAIASDGPSKSGTVTIVLAPTLPGGMSTTSATVLIGSTKEDTLANLLAFLNNPGGSSAGYVGITDADTITAIGYQSYASVSSLRTGGDTTWDELGFVNSGPSDPDPTIVVDGIDYTYDVIAGNYLVNISGVPTEGDAGYQGIVTTEDTPTADGANDFIVTLNNQLFVGSYSSKVIYISADNGYTDFTNLGDLISGDPDFAIIDELPTGMVVKGQAVYIFAGSSNTYLLTPNVSVPIEQPISGSVSHALVVTTVDKQVGAGKSAAISQEFITTVGTDIIYLAQDHQLRQLGIVRNIVTQKTPSLSKMIRQELIDEDFTGGSIRAVDEFTYITSVVSGRTYLYQVRDDVDNIGNLTSTRLWQPPQEWGISTVAVIDGVVYGYSSTNPQIYQLWDTDQWHDDSIQDVPSPYECTARYAYENNGLKTGLVEFDMCYYEGYIAPNSALTGRIRFDYLGGTKNDDQDGVQDVVISSLDEPGGNGNEGQHGMVLFAGESDAELGVSIVGTDQIGGTIDALKGFPKFRVIQDILEIDVFEYQVELYSYEADSRWSVKCFGVNASQSVNNPVFLRKS